MVSLDARLAPPSPRTAPGRGGARTEWLVVTGACAAVLGAAVAMAFVAAITVLVWACGPIATDGVSGAPFRGAASLWLMAQRGPVDAGTFDLVLPPLAITALVVVVTARLAGWAVRATSAFEVRPAAIVGGGYVLGHVVVAGVAGWVSDGAGSGVAPMAAMRAALLFSLPCAIVGIAPQTWPWARTAARIGTSVRIGALAAGKGALALGAGGLFLLLASLTVHHGATTSLFSTVGGGISGGAGTALICLAMLPNAVLWVVSLAAGPGFALGQQSGISLTGDLHAGELPAMPLLGALPDAGPLPGWAVLLLVVPFAAGGVIGWSARPAGGSRGLREDVATGAVSAVLCGIAVGLLAGFSGGGAGGRLEHFGPSGFTVAGMLALELAASAAVVAAARIAWETYRGPRESAPKPGENAADPTDLLVAAAARVGEKLGKVARIPVQKSRRAAEQDSPAAFAVVEASEVEDVPDKGASVTDTLDHVLGLEDTQEFAVLTEDDLRDRPTG